MKPMSATCALSFAMTLIAGCYGAAPPRPATIPLPAISDDAEIAVHSEEHTTIEHVQKQASTCPAGKSEGDQSCSVTHYSVAEPVTRTISTASYGGQPISYAQLRVMTDPNRDAKLATLDHLSHVCTRANIPRYVGLGLMVSSAILISVSGNKGPIGIAGWGALGGGIGSYTLGYVSFGGRQCNEASSLYNDIDVSGQVSWHEVIGEDYASEMQTMAASFNASRGRHASAMRMR